MAVTAMDCGRERRRARSTDRHVGLAQIADPAIRRAALRLISRLRCRPAPCRRGEATGYVRQCPGGGGDAENRDVAGVSFAEKTRLPVGSPATPLGEFPAVNVDPAIVVSTPVAGSMVNAAIPAFPESSVA